jgi:hypothetical protein
MADATAKIQNPGSDTWDPMPIISGTVSRVIDPVTPSEATLEVPGDFPVLMGAGVTIYRSGGCVFRGYVSRLVENRIEGRWKITLMGEEDMLNWRVCPNHIYDRSKHCFIHPFADVAPSPTVDAYGIANNEGLIWAANSLVPPRAWTEDPLNLNNHIWYLNEGGTRSCLYDKPVYANGTALAEKTSKTALVSNPGSYFYEDNKLWIHLADGFVEDYYARIYVENAFDTNVRKGSIDHPEIELSGNFMVDTEKRVGETLLTFAIGHGMYPTWRYEAEHTYLDVRITNGKGQTSGIFDIMNSDIIEREISYGDDMEVTAVVGLGAGSAGTSRQIYTKQDLWLKKGRHFFSTLDIADGFVDDKGTMKHFVDEEYSVRRNSKARTITTALDHYATPRNWVRLWDYSPEVVQVNAIDMNIQGGHFVDTYEFGARKPWAREALLTFDRLQSAWSQTYIEDLDTKTGSGPTTMLDDAHGSCEGYGLTVNFPSTLTVADYNHRVLLSLSFSQAEGQAVIPQKAMLIIYVGAITKKNLWITDWQMFSSVDDIDITEYMSYGTDVTISVFIRKYGEWESPHSNCTGHPQCIVHATCRIVRRHRLPSDV